MCSGIQLKLASNRAQIQRTRKMEEGLRQKKEIAELLKTEKEALARVKAFVDFLFPLWQWQITKSVKLIGGGSNIGGLHGGGSQHCGTLL